jgi:transmembrane sensor
MNVTEFPDLERAREEAAAWIARLDRGLSAIERADLRRWREANPANARALRQMAQLWEGMDVMKVLAEMFPEYGQPAPAQSAPPRRIRGAVAAGLAATALLAGLFAWSYRGDLQAPAVQAAPLASYSTDLGEHRDVPLADGSSLAINTGSVVEVVSLQGATRELRLLRGEAMFTVAHDAARPFRVAVGRHVVEAVGTAFDVRLHDAGVIEVVVTDGRVRLLDGNTATSHLDRNQAIRIAADGTTRVSTLDEQALAARLAWREGMIAFSGQTLSEALREFSRYTSVRFIIADPRIADRPVGGLIPAGDVQAFLDALSINLGLESQLDPDGSIRISSPR